MAKFSTTLTLLVSLLSLFQFQFQFLCSVSSSPNKSLLLPLFHSRSLSISSSPFPSQSHLLKSSSLRSLARFPSHGQRRQQQLPLPLALAAGADYTLSLSISSTTVSLYLDTGSDLLWFPCSPFQCILCDNIPPLNYSHPLPPPPSSHPLPCSSPFCSAAHSSLPISDLCAAALCPLDAIETSSCSPPCPLLYYAYGDGSLLASLRRGHLSSPPLPNLTFACAHSALAEPLGVAGFGPGPLSLPSQLANHSPFLASRFSYCLIHHSFLPHRILRPSPLILGRSSAIPFTYTPLLRIPSFYSVSLLSISVGPASVAASRPLVTRGMVVDSGTTFTMLPAETHRRLVAEFRRQMGRNGFIRSPGAEERTGLGTCYEYGKGRNGVPAMGLHFAGNATLWLPRRNYFMGFESEGEQVGCLMVINGDDEEEGDGPVGTLGNFQQQGIEVVFDLEMGRIGFARRRCGALWDEVSRG